MVFGPWICNLTSGPYHWRVQVRDGWSSFTAWLIKLHYVQLSKYNISFMIRVGWWKERDCWFESCTITGWWLKATCLLLLVGFNPIDGVATYHLLHDISFLFWKHHGWYDIFIAKQTLLLIRLSRLFLALDWQWILYTSLFFTILISHLAYVFCIRKLLRKSIFWWLY